MSMITSELTLDSFPDIKQTLKREFADYNTFLRYLVKSGAPKNQEEFNVFICNLYVTDDIFALLALSTEHAKIHNITHDQIMNIAFTHLYNDYINMCSTLIF